MSTSMARHYCACSHRRCSSTGTCGHRPDRRTRSPSTSSDSAPSQRDELPVLRERCAARRRLRTLKPAWPPDPLVIRLPAFTAKQNMDAPIAVASLERCHLLHALGQCHVARTLTFYSEQRPGNAYQPAGPVIPMPRSVINVLTASRLACGLATFGSKGPEAQPCPASIQPTAS